MTEEPAYLTLPDVLQARRGMSALRLEVPEQVANDFNALIFKAFAAIAASAASIDSMSITRQERDRFRAALIEAGRAAGGGIADTVSTDFLMHVPAQVTARMAALTSQITQLTEERDRLQREVDDAESDYLTVKGWCSTWMRRAAELGDNTAQNLLNQSPSSIPEKQE